MPRNKLVRRFEPRYGVSEDMPAVEAHCLRRGAEDYGVLSAAALKQMHMERRSHWLRAGGTLQVQFEVLPGRERLIAQCLLVRDIHHLLELYGGCLSGTFPGGSGVVAAEPVPRVKEEAKEERTVPFSEWLFEQAPA